MTVPDSTFEFLPLPGLRWAAPRSAGALPTPVPNRAFEHAYALATLPELHAWADGNHTLRLNGRGGDQPLCRVYLCTLPDRSRLGIIENVQDDHQDPLTGLETRRALRLDAAHLQHMTLMLLDVDGFKGVNDTHGHAAGDALLVALAEVLRAGARNWGARAYRLGGDEFVILGAGPLDARWVKDMQAQFRHSAARSGLEVQGFSCGLACTPQDGQTLCELLAGADARLMQQKVDRRGAAAQLLQRLQPAAVGPRPAGHDSRTEMRALQLSWPDAPRPRPRNAEHR